MSMSVSPTFSASNTRESGINCCTRALGVDLPAPWVPLSQTIRAPTLPVYAPNALSRRRLRALQEEHCSADWDLGAVREHTDLVSPRSAASRRHLSASPFNVQPDAEPVESFAVGDRVSHDTHGLGRVIAIEGDTAVVVEFGAGQMRVAAPYRKLFKL